MTDEAIQVHLDNDYFTSFSKIDKDNFFLAVPENVFLEIPSRELGIVSEPEKLIINNVPILAHRGIQCALLIYYVFVSNSKREMSTSLCQLYDEEHKPFSGTMSELMGLSGPEKKLNKQLYNSICYNDCVLVEERELVFKLTKEIEAI